MRPPPAAACLLLAGLLNGRGTTSLPLAPSLDQGPGVNDVTLSEKVVNVVTSLPFMLLGWHFAR